jgi:hypothetical protein
MNRPLAQVAIVHSFCAVCAADGKALCGTKQPIGIHPPGLREQWCVVCSWLSFMPRCERCDS